MKNLLLLWLLFSPLACGALEKEDETEALNYISLLQEEEAYRLGIDAYIYGFPLVLMDVTKQVATNVSHAENFQAPINQFAHLKEFPDPSFKMVVSPNVDTLYSIAWLDLTKEPIILHVPDTHDHYFLMQMLDGWTNVFADPGTRTTGNKAEDFAICGPNFKGTLPEKVAPIKAPTNMVWIIGRTECSDPQDYKAVHEIQQGYRLTPLGWYGKAYTPPTDVPVDADVDHKLAPVEQVFKMDAATFFNRLAELMRSNPPSKEDAPLIDNIRRERLAPDEPFDYERSPLAVQRGLARSIKAAQEKIITYGNEKLINGWSVELKDIGKYGTNYIKRANVAFFGLGANLPQDAVYPYAQVDREGNKLNGTNRYVLHFNKNQIPPANAFWSMTMYDAAHFFVPNSLNRYAIKSKSTLAYNDDGSLDIVIQPQEPKELTSNWLPAPAGEFNLIMRLYWPKAEVLDGKWQPPAVQKKAK